MTKAVMETVGLREDSREPVMVEIRCWYGRTEYHSGAVRLKNRGVSRMVSRDVFSALRELI